LAVSDSRMYAGCVGGGISEQERLDGARGMTWRDILLVGDWNWIPFGCFIFNVNYIDY